MTRGVYKQPTRGGYKQPKVYLVLIFPDSTECRWVWKRPRVGSEIKSSLGDKWSVEDVLQSGTDVYTVHCGPPSYSLADAQDLASDLLVRAREALSPSRRQKHELPSTYSQAGKRVGMLREKPVVGGAAAWLTEAIRIGRSVLGVLKRESRHVRGYLHRFREEHPDTDFVLVAGLASLGIGILVGYL